MITDDWCWGVGNAWDNHSGEAVEWRFTGMPREDMEEVTVFGDDSAIDIEGGQLPLWFRHLHSTL